MSRSIVCREASRFLQALILAVILISTMAVPVVADDTDVDVDIDVEPTRGPVGTTVQVIMTGLVGEGQVAVSFATKDNIVATAEPDDWGYCMASFNVETYPAGAYGIWTKFNTDEYHDRFVLEPSIELNKPSGSVGDNVAISGKGFAADKELTVYFDDVKVSSGEEETDEAETDEDGTFTNLSFTIPEAGKGEHEINVEDRRGNEADASIVVKQAAEMVPVSGTPGSEVSICGTGFESDGNIVIYFDDEDIKGTIASDSGSFSFEFPVPSCGYGAHKVKVSDGTNSFYLDFSVTAGMILTPSTGSVGGHITVQGTGFREGLPVTITYDKDIMQTTNANVQGGFSVTFRAPPSGAGEHLVKATDGDTTVSATYTVESTPPPVPSPILPREGADMSQGVYFDWQGVSDPSGVSYSLVVASDADFSNVLLTKEGLADSEYSLSDEEALPPCEAAYYWRVKAADGASNASEWSITRIFFVNPVSTTPEFISFFSTMPEWAKYSLMALGLVLLCFICFWAGSMRAS